MLAKLFTAGGKWTVHAVLAVILLFFIILIFLSYKSIDQELTGAALSRRASIAYLAAATLSKKLAHLVDVTVSLATRVQYRVLVAEGKVNEGATFYFTLQPSPSEPQRPVQMNNDAKSLT